MNRSGVALVIGSHRADTPQERAWLDLAATFANTLTADPEAGWQLHNNSPLCNPSVADTKTAIKAAITTANTGKGTLLISYIGHGTTLGTNPQYPEFFLQVHDAPELPDSDTGVNLSLLLKEQLAKAPSIDGIVLIIDACSAGALPTEAATNWNTVTGGRLEVLVASGPTDTDVAYNGCFTTTLTTTLQHGVPGRGDNLHLRDLHPRIEETCTAQQAHYTGFANSTKNAHGIYDEGLWLTTNKARAPHCLHDRPDAGILDQVLPQPGRSLSPTQNDTRAQLKSPGRLWWLTGPAGAGKTTLMASLIRPPTDSFSDRSVICGAVFLDQKVTSDHTARELAAQLHLSLDGFTAAHNAIAGKVQADPTNPTWVNAVDVELIHPLREFRKRNSYTPVELIIDGLDQVVDEQRTPIQDLIATLTTIDHVRLIVGSRTPPPDNLAIPQIDTIELSPPTWNTILEGITNSDVADTLPHTDHPVDGGWLTGRLAAALVDPPTEPTLASIADAFTAQALSQLAEEQQAAARATLAILALGGIGPIMPIRVVQTALTHLGHPIEIASLRNLLVALGPLIQRGRPGYPDEHLGIAHQEITRLITDQLLPG